jgi:hypothetical protein
MSEVANFDGLDQQVIEGLTVFFSHGCDGGSFVTALLQQDYKEALLHAHGALSRRSIIAHMEYAKEQSEKHGYNPTFKERMFLCYYMNAEPKMRRGMKAVLLCKHTKPFEVAIINQVWEEEDNS